MMSSVIAGVSMRKSLRRTGSQGGVTLEKPLADCVNRDHWYKLRIQLGIALLAIV